MEPRRTRVVKGWLRLVETRDRSPEASEPSWRELYESCFKQGRWNVSVNDASLVSNLGVTIALQKKRYQEASEIAERFFAHPRGKKIKEEDWVTWAEMVRRLGQSKILEGKGEEGIAALTEVLGSRCPGYPSMNLAMIRNTIADLCDYTPQECAYLLEPLKNLSRKTISSWREKRSRAALVRKADSIEELLKILNTTFASRPSRPIRRLSRRVLNRRKAEV